MYGRCYISIAPYSLSCTTLSLGGPAGSTRGGPDKDPGAGDREYDEAREETNPRMAVGRTVADGADACVRVSVQDPRQVLRKEWSMAIKMNEWDRAWERYIEQQIKYYAIDHPFLAMIRKLFWLLRRKFGKPKNQKC